MRPSIVFPIVIVASLISCNSKKSNTDATADSALADAPTASLSIENSQWRLNDYAGTEEMQVMPDSVDYLLQFSANDSTFTLNTDCNNISGRYTIAPDDSIAFTYINSTLMLCHDMDVEAAFKAILPVIDNYTISPDSVLTLRSGGRKYARFSYAGPAEATTDSPANE